MDLFGSLADMVERDMKDSVFESVYHPSLGSSPLFPDLAWPISGHESSLDQLDPDIMVDPASVVPRRETEQHHQPRLKDEYTLSSVISNSKMVKVEVEESSDDEDDDDEKEEMGDDSDLDDEDSILSIEKQRRITIEDANRRLQQQAAYNKMLVNKKPQKAVNNGIIKVKREVVRSPSGVRSPSSQSVRSPSVVRSPSTHQAVRSPITQASRSPSIARPNGVDSASSSPTSHRQAPVTVTSSYPKPAYSYSCLIAMALKNSPTGSLPVSEIYNFMCEHFPYFKSAPNGWKNSIRHNLSMNQGFHKIEKSLHGSSRKGCLWALNPSRIQRINEEMAKCSKKDPQTNMRAMARPETLDKLKRGEMKIKLRVIGEDEEMDSEEIMEEPGYITTSSQLAIKEEFHEQEVEEDEDEEAEEPDEASEQEDDEEEEEEEDDQSDEEGEVPPSLKPFDRQLNSRLLPSSEHNDIGVEFPEEVYEELGLLEEVLEEADVYRAPVKRQRLDHRSHTQSYRHAIASLQ